MRTLLLPLTGLLFCVSAAQAQVNVSSPSNNATVSGTTQFVADAYTNNGAPITAMRVYVDNNSVYLTGGANINTPISMSAGSHYVVVQAWDAWGGVYKSALTVNVANSSGGVWFNSPSDGASVGAPTQISVSAAPAGGGSIQAMQIYVDNNLAYQQGPGNTMNTSVNIGGGSHYVVAQAWDSNGAIYKAPITVNVGGGGGSQRSTTSIPSYAMTFADLDQKSNWQGCSVCAGAGGNGPSTPFSTTQYRSSPSIDGASQEFWIGGSTPYADALWWNQLGPQPNASNFVYDLYFYMVAPQFAQSLEFDVNQSVNGQKYIFGTQCNIRGSGQWDVWDGYNWQPTGIGCGVPSAYAWHHVTLEFTRANNQVNFVAVTLDGNRQYINRSYNPLWVNASELNVAVQIDGDYAQHNYSVWVDKITLYAW